MWWILLAVPATLLADALLDLWLNRASIGGAWASFCRSHFADELLELETKVVGGYRPKPSSLPKLPPPGTSGLPPKPGCYRADRSVNPRTVRPPKSPTAVTPPSRTVLVSRSAYARCEIDALECSRRLSAAFERGERARELDDEREPPPPPPPRYRSGG